MAIKNKIEKLKTMTTRISKWDSSNEVFGYFQNLKKKANEDKIYEFYVYMRILSDLKKNYTVKFVPNKNAVFPKAPALKSNYAYFVVNSKIDSSGYQICYGTKIELSYSPKTLTAPDISFQDLNSPANPNENHIKIIMDVKYKYDSDENMNIALIHAFMQQITALKTSNAGSENLVFNRLSDFKCNCLITNGEILDLHHDYCKTFFMKQIGNFWADQPRVTAG